ncbi:MAG: phenylacetate--CoA ligase [Anaerolineae bacterium]|nr:phenylacetate--CoA ligase [Anaerolineae bacterium]MCQ3977006.1 phenylacetate--CoA ligase [Anaerolineae bacterium]GIK39045.1 MAG: phenylacetate-coenzyme A ligase [Chloroflexota bacterium]
MAIWNKEFETMPREDLSKLQFERLKALVERAGQTSPYYRKKLAEAGVSAGDLKSLTDIATLPFTTKEELRCNYPWGMFTVPLKEVVRIHASSGTTGKPIVGGYSRADLKLWAEVMARTVTAAGITADDIVHNGYGYGLFTGGLGFHLGAEAVGATVVPASAGLTRRQLMLMEDFGATVLTCTPSYSLVIAEEAAAEGIDIRERLKLRVGVFGAEPWTEKMREEIEAALNLDAYDIYGLTEIIGPGVSVECEHHCGLHIFEDYFYPEIIDPSSGEPLGYGVEGELVFTSLTKEAMPLIRYRTRDRTTLHAEPCACGRTLVRMEKVLGRTDDMLIVRGVNVFPSQIERVLLEFGELEPHYQIIVDRGRHELDTLEVWVEGADSLFMPVETQLIQELEQKIKIRLHEALIINCSVKLMKQRSLERSMGKAVRVVDKRQLQN